MGKKTLFGKVELPEKEFKEVIELVKEGIVSQPDLSDLKRRLHKTTVRLFDWKNSYDQLYEQKKI